MEPADGGGVHSEQGAHFAATLSQERRDQRVGRASDICSLKDGAEVGMLEAQGFSSNDQRGVEQSEGTELGRGPQVDAVRQLEASH